MGLKVLVDSVPKRMQTSPWQGASRWPLRQAIKQISEVEESRKGEREEWEKEKAID